MRETDPSKQKQLGKKIRGFDDNKWVEVCKDVMRAGLLAKFTQNEGALNALTATGHRAIYESNPRDQFWGTGVSLTNPTCLDHSAHTGLNRLGKLLEACREELCFKD